MQVLGIQRRFKGVGRFRQIVVILGKYGFDEFLSRANLPLHLRALVGRKARRQAVGPERLRLAMEELGPTFIKFGQILSTHGYLLPSAYAAELAKLQDQVRPFDFEDVEKIVSTDLGGDLATLFLEFDREPFASASIAQVHMATLRTGERVCVKVQRPEVRETLALDIMILKNLAALLEAHVPESRRFDPSGLVREFERTSRREIDFSIEASSIKVFARNFAGDAGVYILRVYDDYCSPRVLTTEFIDGIKISDVEELKAAGLDPAALARAGSRSVLRQVFEFGFFHADPHPGNLFVTCDGRIAPVDFGIVGRLTRRDMTDLAELFVGLVEADERRLGHAMERLRMLPDEADKRDVIEEVMLLGEKYGTRRLGDINVQDMFSDVTSILRRHQVRIRTEFVLLGKALSIYEEVGRILDPDFSMMEEAGPYARKLVGRRHVLSLLLGERGQALADAFYRLSAIPSDLANILRMAREGRLKIEFEHVGLEKITAEIERASNRLSFSLLVAALIVASSLILTKEGGIPLYRVFGISGFVVAGLVGLWLLVNILRSGRM